MKAIIFNSGIGKRMGFLTKDKPKSMVSLYNGETIFERQIRILNECGIYDFIITTGPYKEQIEECSKKFSNSIFKFVYNDLYDKTNYIYSMYLAKNYINDDVILLHGDLVFNKKLVQQLLKDHRPSICLINKRKALPQKDFKGRIKNNLLKEVSINIFDKDCFAFQPLYKLSKSDINKWMVEVEEFIKKGIDNVYAENALNKILNNLSIGIMPYDEYYIDEIDNQDDYLRVNEEIEIVDKNDI